MGSLSIIMNICHRVKFHPLYLFLGISCILTSLFKEFLLMSSLIFVHEMGHVVVATYFHWGIEKVVLYPFGGITYFKTCLNRPLKEEFFVALAGVVFQSLYYFFFVLFFRSFLREEVFCFFESYHFTLLWFNLLPVFSLDGAKIVSVLLEYYFPYKFVHRFILVLSYIILIVICLKHPYQINFYLLLGLLFCKVFFESRQHEYRFNQFLLERYLYDYSFSKRKVISHIEGMMRDYKHTIKRQNHYETERQVLKKRFDKW